MPHTKDMMALFKRAVSLERQGHPNGPTCPSEKASGACGKKNTWTPEGEACLFQRVCKRLGERLNTWS
eukprot:1231473-Amphidinium_carterae.2